jgi:hypothetical protein
VEAALRAALSVGAVVSSVGAVVSGVGAVERSIEVDGLRAWAGGLTG